MIKRRDRVKEEKREEKGKRKGKEMSLKGRIEMKNGNRSEKMKTREEWERK